MKLRILFVEDNADWQGQLLKFFDDEKIGEHSLVASSANSFDEGKAMLATGDYDIVVLDLYQGEPKEGNPKTGLEILGEIQKSVFVPVIFFTGLTKDIDNLASEIVGVVNKADGLEALKVEVEKIISSKLALIKQQIYGHIGESLRAYFWDTVHSENRIFEPGRIDVSLGYLLLRRIANSLSKENIKTILGDDTIKVDKAHPMEFYIFPPEKIEYEAGEILEKDEKTYVILTPTCDFANRKAEGVLLGLASHLTETTEYKKFKDDNTKPQGLQHLVESRKGDRFFFLPGTPFIKNMVLDFQRTEVVEYADLKTFKRVAKLDNPFAQAMATSFTRYYNRVGYPDIDSDHIIRNL